MRSKKDYFGGLDVIRFCSALLVVAFHIGFLSWADTNSSSFAFSGGSIKLPEISAVTWAGWVGVEIFFVISGLVICQSAEGRTPYLFLRGRIARLMPGIWICASISFIIVMALGVTHWKWAAYSYLRSLLMILTPPWIDGVYWTLAIEIVFYATVFLLLCTNRFRFIELYAVLLGAFSFSYLVAKLYFGAPDVSALTLASHGCLFSLGINIWLISAKGISVFRCAVVAFALVGGLIEITITANARIIFVPRPPSSETIFWLPHAIWIGAVIGIFFCALRPVAGSGTMRALGLMTYPLYLIHNSLGCAALRSEVVFGINGAIIFSIVLTLTTAWIVVHLEKILRSRLESLLDRTADRARSWSFVNFLFRKSASL